MGLDKIQWQEVSWTAPATSRPRRATLDPLSPTTTSTTTTTSTSSRKKYCPTNLPALFRHHDKTSTPRASLDPPRVSESAEQLSQASGKGAMHMFQRANEKAAANPRDSLVLLRGREAAKGGKGKGRIHTFRRASGEWLSIVAS